MTRSRFGLSKGLHGRDDSFAAPFIVRGCICGGSGGAFVVDFDADMRESSSSE